MAQGKDISVVLNAIRSTASDAYQSTVPKATFNNITDVGEAVLNAPTAIRNEFMSNLYNKIGLTLVDSPVIENEFAFLKKGTLEYGQTIEDLYVGLASAEPYVTGMNDVTHHLIHFQFVSYHITQLSILLSCHVNIM